MIRKLVAFKPQFIWSIALLAVAFIAAIDYLTGVFVTLSAFYLFPLFLVAWARSRFETYLLVFVIVTAWASANYLYDTEGLTTGILFWNCFIRWIHLTLTAELVRYIHRLMEDNDKLANTDGLTGILNRRAFSSKMQKLLSSSVTNKIATFTLIDVDFFKGINDINGHSHGDEILKRVADVISQECRNHEFCGRFGGDEFAIVLFNDDVNEAKIRIGELAVKLRVHAASCSLGTALVQIKEPSSLIFEQADKALYQTKLAGKGFATIYYGDEYLKAGNASDMK